METISSDSCRPATPDAPTERGGYRAVATALGCCVSGTEQRRGARADKARRRQSGFTLIELLAVLLIAVLLISLGYAGYNEMRKTTGIGTAARNVADALSIARQSAVSSGYRSRFLIQAGGGYGDTHYQYGVVREVPGVRINGNRSWEWVSHWQGLPMGVVFAGTLPPSTSTLMEMGSFNARVFTNAATWYTHVCFGPDNNPAYNTIEFNREGRPSQTWTVTVARGYYTGGEGQSATFATSGVDYASVILDSQTGKARVVRK